LVVGRRPKATKEPSSVVGQDQELLTAKIAKKSRKDRQEKGDPLFFATGAGIPIFQGILPGENSVNVPLGNGGPFGDIWQGLGLPSGLSCPQVGGFSNYLCGGVNPIMDADAANNGQDCDNACQLGRAINKTGVQALQNPCTSVAFLAGGAAAGTIGVGAANSGAVLNWAVTTAPAWANGQLGRILWNGIRPGAGVIAAVRFYGKLAWNSGASACNAMQGQ